MRYDLAIPGFETRPVSIETAGFFSGPKVLVGGEPAPTGPLPGQFRLAKPDGTEAIATLKSTFFLDPIPQFSVGGQTYRLAEPLKWYEWAWCALPIALVFVGGALGAGLGMLAMFVNSRLFRGKLAPPLRFGATGLVSLVTVVLYFGLALALGSVINSVFSQPTQLVSDAGRFSITAPTRLTEQTQDVSLGSAGHVELHLFTGDRNGITYYTSYVDYPQSIMSQGVPENMLVGARDGIATNMGGTLTSDKAVTLGTHPGRDFALEGVKDGNNTYTVQIRLYLVENRLYQNMVILPTGSTDSSAQPFLDSFTLSGD